MGLDSYVIAYSTDAVKVCSYISGLYGEKVLFYGLCGIYSAHKDLNQ